MAPEEEDGEEDAADSGGAAEQQREVGLLAPHGAVHCLRRTSSRPLAGVQGVGAVLAPSAPHGSAWSAWGLTVWRAEQNCR